MGAEVATLADQTFDRMVALGRELFGPPVARVDGQERFVHWRGGPATITNEQGTTAVFVDCAGSR